MNNLRISMHLLLIYIVLHYFVLLISSTHLNLSINSSTTTAQSNNVLLVQQTVIINHSSPEKHFIELLLNATNNYQCNFNQLHYCSFDYSSNWNFQLSLQEFAMKMKKAAELADLIVRDFQEKLSHKNVENGSNNNGSNVIKNNNESNMLSSSPTTSSTNSYFPIPFVHIPTVNYFPCSSTNNDQQQYSYLKLSIEWPKYFQTHHFVVPEDVTPVHVSNQLSTVTESTVQSTSSIINTVKQKRSSSYHSLKPLNDNHNNNNNTMTLKHEYTFSNLNTIACLQLKIKFLPNNHSLLGSKVILSLGSNKQIIQNIFPTNKSNHHQQDYAHDNLSISYKSYAPNISIFNWSTLHRRKLSDLNNNTLLPYHVWINVSMPIYPTTTTTISSSSSSFTSSSSSTDPITPYHESVSHPHEIFTEQSNHWIVVHSNQLLTILTTNNVCIDDISLFTHKDRSSLTSLCPRQLIWFHNDTTTIQQLYINTEGYPMIKLNETNSLSQSNRRNRKNHQDNSTNLYVTSFFSFENGLQMIWIAGSLLLTVFIIFLAILFIITFSLSVICTRRKQVHFNHKKTLTTENNISSRNEKCKNNTHKNNDMGLFCEQKNRRKFYLNRHHYHCELLNVLPNSSLLIDLHNHLSSSSSLHGLLNQQQQQQPNHLQLDSQQHNSQQQPHPHLQLQQVNTASLTTHQQCLDDNSTELSLCIQDDKNDLMNSINRQISDNSNISTTTTAALQLLRNWNFYKQRSTTPITSISSSCCRYYAYSHYPPTTSCPMMHQQHRISPIKCSALKRANISSNVSLLSNNTNNHPNHHNRNSININDNLLDEENIIYRCHSSQLNNDHHRDHHKQSKHHELRQSLILSFNENNQLILLPSSESNDQQHIDHHDHRSTSNMLNSLSEEDAEATRLEMATSVNALDKYFVQDINTTDNNNNNSNNTLDNMHDYTLSTIPRSMTMTMSTMMMNNDTEQPPPSYHD
ncbi:unnamed protein product [Schistosoma turkestanicum]|nr:unnamed protein product [Schistosoma turkestanicum]